MSSLNPHLQSREKGESGKESQKGDDRWVAERPRTKNATTYCQCFIQTTKHWRGNENCWGDCRMRPEGPKIKDEGRQRGLGSWGWGAASSSPTI